MCSLAQHTTEGWSNSIRRRADRRGLPGDRGRAVWSCSTPNGPSMIRPSSATSTTSSSSRIRCCGCRGHLPPFGIDFTDEARAAICGQPRREQEGPRAPKHTYSLADYGLTDEQVKERFKGLVTVRPSY